MPLTIVRVCHYCGFQTCICQCCTCNKPASEVELYSDGECVECAMDYDISNEPEDKDESYYAEKRRRLIEAGVMLPNGQQACGSCGNFHTKEEGCSW